MQLIRSFVLAAACCAALVADAGAQSLSPMRHQGATPSDIKGFRLVVGNPYRQRMTFVAIPMTPDFTAPVTGAAASPAEFRLAPGASRPVLIQFRIDREIKERTIGLCIYPKDLEGPVLPRVCGTYTGRLAGTRKGG